MIHSILFLFAGFLPVAIALIYADVTFYTNQYPGSLHDHEHPQRYNFLSYITPLNSLLYNSNVNNLTHHGLHTRSTHILINMPMLFGPLSILFYIDTFRRCRKFIFDKLRTANVATQKKEDPVDIAPPDSPAESITSTMCRGVLITSLIFLSIAPHQEPRFILPLIIPLSVLQGPFIMTRISSVHLHKGKPYFKSTVRMSIWIVFNALLLVFFGVLHQAGVLPTMIHLGNVSENIAIPRRRNGMTSSTTTTSSLFPLPDVTIFFHTYMPPTFLSRSHLEMEFHPTINYVDRGQDCSDAGTKVCTSDQAEDSSILPRSPARTCRNIPRFMDLKGESVDRLIDTLNLYIPCVGRDETNSNIVVHVVAPPVTLGDARSTSTSDRSPCPLLGEDHYSCSRVWTYFPHVTTEDFPSWDRQGLRGFFSDLELVTYRIQCSAV